MANRQVASAAYLPDDAPLTVWDVNWDPRRFKGIALIRKHHSVRPLGDTVEAVQRFERATMTPEVIVSIPEAFLWRARWMAAIAVFHRSLVLNTRDGPEFNDDDRRLPLEDIVAWVQETIAAYTPPQPEGAEPLSDGAWLEADGRIGHHARHGVSWQECGISPGHRVGRVWSLDGRLVGWRRVKDRDGVLTWNLSWAAAVASGRIAEGLGPDCLRIVAELNQHREEGGHAR